MTSTAEHAPDHPDDLRKVRLNLDAIGQGQVVVDGHDLSTMVRGVQLTADARQAPEIVLILNPRAGSEFDGYARVVVGEQPDPGPAAAVFLAAIDPGELEKAALASPDLGSGEHALTRVMLDVLGAWASGRS